MTAADLVAVYYRAHEAVFGSLPWATGPRLGAALVALERRLQLQGVPRVEPYLRAIMEEHRRQSGKRVFSPLLLSARVADPLWAEWKRRHCPPAPLDSAGVQAVRRFLARDYNVGMCMVLAWSAGIPLTLEEACRQEAVPFCDEDRLSPVLAQAHARAILLVLQALAPSVVLDPVPDRWADLAEALAPHLDHRRVSRPPTQGEHAWR
jgi:hypothetical protein